MRQSTAGWKLCIQWKDGSNTWDKLSDLKELHPIETAEYDMSHGLEFEPTFNWWVPFLVKKRERIISRVKKRSARYLKRDEKCGTALPKTAKEVYELDKATGSTLWANTISKEIENVKVALKSFSDNETVHRDH